MSISDSSVGEAEGQHTKNVQQNLRQNVISATGWSATTRIGSQLLSFTFAIILMRLLSPEMFGIMGMIMVFIGFAKLFSDFGLSAAIIQRENLETRHLNSAFWFNFVIGLCLTLTFVVLSPLVARFYGNAILTPLTIVASFNFVIGSLSIIQRSLLVRKMDFRNIAFVEVLAFSLGGGVGIGMALLGYGVWSLVGQSVVTSVSNTLLMWVVSDWRPSGLFQWGAIRDLWRFGAYLMGGNILLYCVRHFDDLLVGRVFGGVELGLYTRAYGLMMLPLGVISRLIAVVLFPAFSSIQHDKERVARGYLEAIQAVALITFPLMIGLLVISQDFVLTFFGEEWIGLVPLIRVFCLAGMIESISTFNGTIYQSQGRPDLQFRVAIAVGLVSIVAIVVGLQWGVLGVAVGYATYSLVATYPTMAIALSLVGLNFSTVVKNLTGILGCTLIMGFTVWGMGWLLLPASWPHWLRLAVQVPFGVLLYLLLIHLFRIPSYLKTRKVVWEQVQTYLSAKKRKPVTVPVSMESKIDG